MKTINNSLNKTTGFHHVAVKAFDFDHSYRFYTEILGFNDSLQWGEADERAAMLDVGDGSYIELFAGGKKPDESESALIHFALEVENCDYFYDRALGFKCRSQSAPEDLVINGRNKDVPIRIAFVYGPDNEVIEFFQYR